MSDVERELGRVAGAVEAITERVDAQVMDPASPRLMFKRVLLLLAYQLRS